MLQSPVSPRQTISSPCIGVCALEGAGRCRGCLRTVDEITGWARMDEPQRQYLMREVLPARALAVGSLAATLPGGEWLLRALRPLAVAPSGKGWNHDDLADLLPATPPAEAAVLAGLVPRTHGVQVLLTRRTESLRNAVAELDRLSRTDAMTGSLNYRGFTEAGERLWQAARDTGRPLSVLALDIDHFKRYNDLYGHAEGDGALRRFAGAVRSALLHADDVLARPGGEEFIVFLPGSTLEQAMKVGERVCQRVRDADIVHAASSEGRMTVSIGIATRQSGDDEVEQMLRRADAALYRAKAAGRNRASD